MYYDYNDYYMDKLTLYNSYSVTTWQHKLKSLLVLAYNYHSWLQNKVEFLHDARKYTAVHLTITQTNLQVHDLLCR